MRIRVVALGWLAMAWFTVSGAGAGARDATRDVNVFIGTGGHGHTYPGAAMPFGMVQLSPDTYNEGWDWCSGYHISDGSIMGFSHTHLSGTGVGDMLDVLVMPGTGPVRLVPGDRDKPGTGYRSRFSHQNEKAEPGYYSVLLDDYQIKAELSASERAGIHRYTFPKSDSIHFMIDLAHAILSKVGAPPRVLSAEMKVMGRDTIVGGRRVDNWAKGRHIYFALKFSKPFTAVKLYSADQPADDGGATPSVEGKYLKAVADFGKTRAGEAILVKVGLSGVSAEGAFNNLTKEIPGWDFDVVRGAAHAAWQRELGRIQIETKNEKHRQIFYTALYHTMLAPTLYDDVDGQYRAADLTIKRLAAGAHNYSTYSLWDTYRALHPLFTLMQRQRVPVLLDALARLGDESPDGAPVWPLQGRETGCMTGYHSAAVIAEAAVKGFTGIDYGKAYRVLRRRAMEEDYRGLGDYRKMGYIPSDKEEESATKTLEYSYDDWAMAQLARKLGHEDDAAVFEKRSLNYRNLWDKETGFIRPRLASGEFAAPFDPKKTGASKQWRDFTEANSWQATWQAQQDPQGYVTLLGGREALVKKLDALFTESSAIEGEVPVDMTGLVGMYAHGNEPSHHVAYLYCYAGEPWKTQQRVRNLLDTQYNNQPAGLSGNEDCGQMSAWYVISALGFYAVDPASGNYVMGAPRFDRAVVDVGAGRPLIVEAKRKTDGDIYVQSVSLNGVPLDKVWFKHSDIAQGGTLVFVMGPEPNKSLGAAAGAAPPSLSR
jgi:predicted alpha-1,2-mannosidase